jgi:hypothetical protein
VRRVHTEEAPALEPFTQRPGVLASSQCNAARRADGPPLQQMTPAFNGLFYATVATIVPVLFLALAVQGRFFEELLTLYIANTRRVRQDPQLRKS